MKRLTIVLSALFCASPSFADQLVSQGTQQTGTVYYGTQATRTSRCFPTVIRARDGKLYRRNIDCPDEPRFSDIAVPLDGHVNNASRRHARHFRILHNGMVRLY